MNDNISISSRVMGQCSGVSSTSPNVCSSHGLCVSNKCKCYDFSSQNTIISDTSGILKRNYLAQGEQLVSTNSRFQLSLNASGVVVISDLLNSNAIISTTPALANGFSSPFQLRLSSTGSLEIYGNNVLALSLTSNPVGSAPFRFLMQNNGDAILLGKGESIYYRTSNRILTTEGITWTGTNCADYSCFGVLASNSSVVCGGVGQCLSPNVCQCPNGTYGNTCERYCYGLYYTNKNVCSGKGSCIANDTCSCLAGYSGNSCTDYSCNGILYNESTNPLLCNGKGSCVSPNLCSCSAGYYGNNCETFYCQGKLYNNTGVCSGKGDCKSPDVCQCQSGYSGSDCSQYSCFGVAHDSTNTLPCNGHGSCISPDKCSCASGYFGESCDMFSCSSILKNETSIVCSGNGTCIGLDQCQCKSGYSGNNCEDYKCGGISFNQSGVCSGNGSCIAPETCVCAPGYYGNNCELFDCFDILFNNDSSCSGNGDCISPNTCSCLNGFYGETCSEFDCFNIPKNETGLVCSGNGTCQLPDQCNCKPGYEGLKCETFYCYGSISSDSNACNGNGYCVAPDDCICKEGYSGSTCGDHYCFGIAANSTGVLPCSGHGVCSKPNQCLCSNGYMGEECETFKCFDILKNESASCSSNGTCIGPDNCTCFEGHEGTACEIYKCYGVLPSNGDVCSGNGLCVGPNQCMCFEGYSGSLCDIYTCFGTIFNSTEPQPCSGKGTCQSPDHCQCLDGYLGENCETFKCFGILKNETSSVCSGNGTCSGPDQCICNSGYESTSCESYRCYGILFNESNVCSSNGYCVKPNDCVCSPQYYGDECNKFSCFGFSSNDSTIVCSGHGSCNDADKCECFSGYLGETCFRFKCFEIFENETNIVCSGNGTCIGPDQCQCKSGYSGNNCEEYKCGGISFNQSGVCSGKGSCFSPDSCLCEEGYYGNNCELFDCFGILFNNTVTLPCSSNGVCISPNTCSCSNGFYGETCSEFDCFSIPKNETGLVCSGNGTCQLPDQCNCKPGYEGLKCESYRCGGTLFNDSSVCNGKGSCISSEVCSCYEGYSGISCSEFSCYGNFNSSTVSMPCSGNGSCIMPDKCICNENYYGDECQYFNCFGSLFSDAGNVCSGHGTCDRPDYCSCFAGYFGNNCSLFKCANYLSNETNACSGKGICFAPDSCLCSDGYTGENCEKFSCFGKVFNNATDLPCHGKGSCIAPDTCTCNSGYFGNECDQFKCFNILQNDTGLVCSGNGICTSLDQCNCSQGFEGAKCNLFKCYNRLFNDSSVCSGNGVCVQPDQCQCNEGHNGPLCNNYYCFGIASNSTNILPCSGKGVCEAPDQCLCNSGFFGSKCDSFKCFGEEFNNTNVCSGRGQCIAPDQCTCNINYEGSNCENFKCFSKLNNDSTTCSGNGQCIDFDKCHCNTNWFGINCSVTSCFNKLSNDTSVCSGSGSCKQPNTCSCKQDYYGENCEVFKCFSHLSNQTDIVCGGKGSCVGLNNCTCRDGFVSKDCSVNIQPFNISLPKVSDTTYKSSDPYTVEIISALGGLNVSWYCMNCIAKSASSNLKVGKVGNSKSLAITTSELKAGTYLFAVNATMPNILPFPARISNTLYFELTIIDMNTPQVQTIGLPNVFLSKSSQELSAVVSSVVLNQSIIDGFLNCSANCTVTVSYSWAITTFNGLSITEEGVTNAINLGDNKIVLSPPIQLSSQLSSINGSVTFSFNLTNLQSTIGSTVEIPVVTAPNPPSINGQIIGTNTSISNLMRVMPSEGIALTDIFTIIIIEWSADPRLSPLTYAVGFLDNHDNPIQVTEFTTSTRISIYLPYIKSLKSSTKTRSLEENSLEPIQLVVFVKDSEGNIDWLQSATVYLAPFNGTTSELLDRLNVLYGTSTSVIAMFDQSYLVLGSSDLTLQLIKNITIDPKNPSAALATLNSLTSDLSSVSSAVVIEINNKLTSFISSIDSIYVDEKQQYGFVKSKLKAADVTTTVGISSNLLASGLEADGTKYVVSNLSSTILKGEIPKIITSQTNLDSVSIRTTLIDLAVASFKLMTANQLNQTLLSGNNSVVVNISSILETYNGFAKDCGLTLITYNKNTNFDNSTGRVASNINDFKFIQDSLTLPLQSLQNPISLTFALVESIEKILVNLKMESSNKTSNDSTLQLVKYEEIFSCKYWDETDRLWSSRGCSLKSVDVSSRTISCSCDHTTMFTTFVEQNSTFAKNVKDQVSALYGVQIGFGVVYTVIATGILIGLFILRNEQPVSSRLFTPYFGMVALIMESILIYIIQRSILANQLMNSSPEVWEQGDSVANIIANVVAIVVNTLNLTAILCYVIQVSRFQLMKYLHQLMASSRGNEEKSEKTLMILRYITSPTLSFSILTSFGFINVIYWLFWVMLRRLNAIEPATYTYIVSISYTVCILTFSVLISCVVVLDFLGSSYKQIQNSKMKRTNLDDLVDNPNTSFRKDKVKFSQVNIRNLLTDFVVSMDGPLYFRMEMLMYLVCFTFLILNQGIGLSSLPFRYESVESFKKALLIDGISFIFEVLYVISYIFVFGGYALIVALNYKYKKWKKHRDTNIEKRSSMEQEELWIDINIQEIFATPEGIQIFETFCVKEFSTENLYLYLDCLAKKDVCKGENMKELPELMSFVFNNYIKNGAPAEVNIPSNSRNSFLYLFRAVLELKETFRSSTTSLEENLSTDLQSLSKELKLEKANEIQVTKQSVTECFDLLERNLLINIGDTFSRFIHTPEFRVYKKAKELQNILVERTNIVYGI